MTANITKIFVVCFLLQACGTDLPSVSKSLFSEDSSPAESGSTFHESYQYEHPTIPEQFSMDAGGLVQYFTLTGKYSASVAQRTQIMRPFIEESFYQEPDYYGSLSAEFLLNQGFAGSPDMKVTVNEVPVDKAQFKVQKAAKKIAFANPPPSRALIKIVDHVDQPLPTAFAIDPMAGRTGLKVMVDGLEAPDAQMDPATGTLVFASAPRDGAKIDVVYNKVIEPTYTYQFEGIAKTPIIRGLKDQESGDVLAATLTPDTFEIHEDDYLDGRKVALNYSEGELAANQILIGLDETAEFIVTSNESACTPEPALVRTKEPAEAKEPPAPKDPKEPKPPKPPKEPKPKPMGPKEAKESKFFAYKDGVMTVNCPLTRGTAFTVQVTKYPKPRYEVPAMDGSGNWMVRIDGELTDEFHLEDNVLVVDAELPASATIELSYGN